MYNRNKKFTHTYTLIGLLTLLTACGAGGTIPKTLLDIEGSAEDTYDKALLKDWVSVKTASSELATNWNTYRPTADKDGAPASVLTDMDDAISQLSAVATNSQDVVIVARAANQVSAYMDELFGLYDPTVPPAIIEMDYLGRVIVLDAMANDVTLAGTDFGTLVSVWKGVKQSAIDAGGKGKAAAADFDSGMAGLESNIASEATSTVIDGANNILELVDSLEKVY